MAKMSKEVSKGLGAAIAEAQSLMNGNDENKGSVDDLLNSGADVQKKRKRRTKTEMEAARNKEQSKEENSLFAEIIPEEKPEDNRPEWEKRSAKNHEEFCEWELQKAALNGKPEPEFDFRNFYEQGSTVYYVRYMPRLGEKEVMKLYLRTVYPRFVVGVVEKSFCECFVYGERDFVFEREEDANAFCATLEISNRFGNKYDENGKKKRKRKQKEEDEFEEELDNDMPNETEIYEEIYESEEGGESNE